jgi:hypothetical protein
MDRLEMRLSGLQGVGALCALVFHGLASLVDVERKTLWWSVISRTLATTWSTNYLHIAFLGSLNIT